MLLHLHVKNLALIEEVEMEFGPGLNILTGETGAGKSILLGSMQLILGSKSSRDIIRANADYALVELLFQIENTKVLDKLRKLDIEAEDGQILLSRKIMDGRSINKINGQTSTVGQMKAVASCLLDIHGQHEHQSLLYAEKQLEILDDFGKDGILPAKEKVNESFSRYRKAQKALADLNIDEEQKNREIAFLEFEVEEIEKAALTEGEDEELERRYRKLTNARKIVDVLQNVYTMTGADMNGAADQTGNAVREISRVTQYDEALLPMEEMLGEIEGLLSDFNRELSVYMDDLVFDEEEFYETEKRLDLINNLKAKYGKNISDIKDYQKRQSEKLKQLYQFDENLQLAKQELEKAGRELAKNCEILSSIRKQYALELEKQIISGLKDLNFLDVSFGITFIQKASYSSNGWDEVEYEISTNPGETKKPLGRIVSGGELSRIMLAIKTILAKKDEIDTLIFDEIDTGISGRTAQKVSEKMAVIGAHHQVLCITHLPQIASMADTHFEIEKHVEGNETTTNIHILSSENSIRELARLLGGAEITEAVYQNAKEMKKLAENHKKQLRN